MADRERKFRELLIANGVTKCYISEDFDFTADIPTGEILVNKNSSSFIMNIYKIFTKDPDGFLGEDQNLFVDYDDFSTKESNYSLEV